MALSKNFRFVTLVLTCCLLLTLLSCANKLDKAIDLSESSLSEGKPNISEYSAIGKEDSYDIVSENDNYRLLFDSSNCNIAIRVKRTNYLWKTFSAQNSLTDILSDEVRNEYMSQLFITFYDEKEKKHTMDSYTFTQKAISENGIKC